jgi:hypothetical protein
MFRLLGFRFPRTRSPCHLVKITVVGGFASPFAPRRKSKEKSLPTFVRFPSGGMRLFGVSTLLDDSDSQKRHPVSPSKNHSRWKLLPPSVGRDGKIAAPLLPLLHCLEVDSHAKLAQALFPKYS